MVLNIGVLPSTQTNLSWTNINDTVGSADTVMGIIQCAVPCKFVLICIGFENILPIDITT